MKRRLVGIQRQLVALGYNPDGSTPAADAVQTGSTAPASTGAGTPAPNTPTPAKRPSNAA